jgi:tetratricopeptide (TPR) repeat protein
MSKDTQKPRKPSGPKSQRHPIVSRPLDESATQALSTLLDQLATLSQQLRQSSERAAASQALSPIEQQPAPIALAYADALGSRRESDAADVALALSELSQHQALRKEAKRALLRLRSAGIAPNFTVPASEAAAKERQRVFYQGYVSQTREQGEVQVALAWYENQTTGDVRGMVFLLEFWRDGVKDFLMTDVTTTKRFQQDFSRNSRSGEQVDVKPISLAQARQLVQEALEINTWRKTALPDAYKRHYATIRDQLLNASISADEEQAVLREGDRPWITSNLEGEELVANALGAWSFGDYGLFYDLLADDHPARRAQTRAEFVQVRRQWAGEAEPLGLRVLLLREQADNQPKSGLWVPTNIRTGARKEVEAFWSMLLKDSPIGGQVEELPMATIINRDTNRHWYWTGYTLAQQDGVWRISRQRDEGLLTQGTPIPELQQRVKDLTEEASKIAQSQPTSEEEAEEATRNLFGAVATSLHSSDALIARLPLDRAAYDQAALDARSIGQYERGAAYYQRMLERFSDRARLLTQLGIMQYLAGERDQQEGNQTGAQRWWDSAGVTLEEAVTLAPSADTYQALAELRLRARRLEEAEQLIRRALELDDTRAERWGQLGSIQMNRNEARAALESFQKAAQRNPDLVGIQFHLGRAYRALGETENARLAYEESIRRNPTDTEAINNLAALLEDQDPPQAIKLLENAVALAPNVALYHANLAALLLKTDATRRGKAELELAERLEPNNPVVRQVRAFAKSLKV